MSTHPSPRARAFVALRGLFFAACFVALWWWLAELVRRRYDPVLALPLPALLRPLGLLLATGGAVLAVLCVGTFITRGRGTPAPFDPPRAFVVSGPYRHVRNPMYVGAAGVLAGSGLLLRSPAIVLLAVVFVVLAHLMAVLYEEPALRRRFGADYERYLSTVPRWLPRLSPRAAFLVVLVVLAVLLLASLLGGRSGVLDDSF